MSEIDPHLETEAQLGDIKKSIAEALRTPDAADDRLKQRTLPLSPTMMMMVSELFPTRGQSGSLIISEELSKRDKDSQLLKLFKKYETVNTRKAEIVIPYLNAESQQGYQTLALLLVDGNSPQMSLRDELETGSQSQSAMLSSRNLLSDEPQDITPTNLRVFADLLNPTPLQKAA